MERGHALTIDVKQMEPDTSGLAAAALIVLFPDGTIPAEAFGHLGEASFGGGGRARIDSALITALARAYRWKRMPDDGRYASVSALATAEKLDGGA